MAGTNEHEAERRFIEPLQQSVSCVSNAVIQKSGQTKLGFKKSLTTGLIEIKSRLGRIGLELGQIYTIVQEEYPLGPYKVKTLAYSYAIWDQENKQILRYDWHPNIVHELYPHLHIGAGAGLALPELKEALIPTGRVAIEEVVFFVIDQLKVEPERKDWREVLNDNMAKFAEFRTWSAVPPSPR